MSDVYSFGVVLLELLTGRRSVDKNRPNREHNLVEWARPLLNDARKLGRIIDPKLEGQYSEIGARKAAALAYECLSNKPKHRPTMTSVVTTLEALKDFDDSIPSGTFMYTVPVEINYFHKDENGGKHNLKSPKSSPKYRRNVLNSPLHHKELIKM